MKKTTGYSEFDTSKELGQARRDALKRWRRRKPKAPLLTGAEYVPATILIKKICQADTAAARDSSAPRGCHTRDGDHR